MYRYDRRYDDAIALIEDVLRSEPENRGAWGGLSCSRRAATRAPRGAAAARGA